MREQLQAAEQDFKSTFGEDGPTDEQAARAKEFEKAIELLTNSMSKEDTNALLVDVLDSLKTLINGKGYIPMAALMSLNKY